MKLHEAGTAGVLACEFAGRLAPSTNGGRDSARTRRRKRPARKCSPISRCESSCRYRRTKKRVRLPRPVRHERGEGRGEGCLTTANRLTIAKRLLSPVLCQPRLFQPMPASTINPNGVAPRRPSRAAAPLGLCSFNPVSQGSSSLATLGWRPESRWDSAWELPQPIAPNPDISPAGRKGETPPREGTRPTTSPARSLYAGSPDPTFRA